MEIYENRNLKDLDGEIWKDIEEYNGDYQVSNFGRIKSFKYDKISGNILKQNKNTKGYLKISLCEYNIAKTKEIHRLEFKTFNNYKLKKGEVVHHIDKNLLNNILDNFQLMTNSEHHSFHAEGENNSFYGKQHSEETKRKQSNKRKEKYRNGELKKLNQTGENNNNCILIEQKVIRIKLLLDEGILTQKEIGKMFGVHESTISNIKNRRIWTHIKIEDL